VNIAHWMRRENSGLVRSTIELAKYEERAGHGVTMRAPHNNELMYGDEAMKPDVHAVHSQLWPGAYFDRAPKFMWMHGEPLSSVSNGVSMKAIVELSTQCEAFFCMRREEWPIWNAIRRTFYVPKGIDLERYRPLDPAPPMLAGEPAILYCENWRGQRNPLYLCIAMQQVVQKLPRARLHLYNCSDKKLFDTFRALLEHGKWWSYVKSFKGGETDINRLYNRAHIVVSGLYPLYARGIEAFGAGRAFIGPGYREPEWPYHCELDVDSMADAIVRCWENYDQINYRQYAERHHDVAETVRQSVDHMKRYL
jgi:glycosyltransferase involved in cell wall biosynthesis